MHGKEAIKNILATLSLKRVDFPKRKRSEEVQTRGRFTAFLAGKILGTLWQLAAGNFFGVCSLRGFRFSVPLK